MLHGILRRFGGESLYRRGREGILGQTVRRGWAVPLLAAALAAHGQEGAKPGTADSIPGLEVEVHSLDRPVQDFFDLLVLPGRPERRVDAKIEFGQDAFGKRLFIRWSGLLRVPHEGAYTFFTESDDGSRLYVGDTKVVSNGGRHGMTEESGQAKLKAGNYRFRVEYFNASGKGGCIVRWQGPGVEKQVIPAEAFFHRKRETADEEPGSKVEPAAKPKVADGPIRIDPKVVGEGNPAPGVVGRVSSVFSDGVTTMLTLRVPPKKEGTVAVEASIFVRATAKVRYVGLAADVTRPTKGMVAYVWLKDGSTTDAATVAFTPDRE